jgi:hypothetical protein
VEVGDGLPHRPATGVGPEPVHVPGVPVGQLTGFVEADQDIGAHLGEGGIGIGPHEVLARQPQPPGHVGEGHLVHAAVLRARASPRAAG